MKCTKCGYMSFDFNQVCPKCSKDVSDVRDKMGLPAYRPSPPALLGALVGEADDSSIGLGLEGGGGLASAGVDMSPEDSQAIEAMEEAFQDSQSLELPSQEASDDLDIADLITVSPEDIAESEAELGGDDLASLDLGEETVAAPDEAAEEDVALDIEDLELDAEPALDESQELDLDLEPDLGEEALEPIGEDDLSLDEGDTEAIDISDVDDLTAHDGETAVQGEEDAVDIEDLDLDLELEEPKG